MARTPAKPKPATTDAPEGAIAVLRVIGPERGRRRAGRRFGPEPVDIPVDQLSEGEIAALQADPLLIVSFGAVPADSDPGEGGDAAPKGDGTAT